MLIKNSITHKGVGLRRDRRFLMRFSYWRRRLWSAEGVLLVMALFILMVKLFLITINITITTTTPPSQPLYTIIGNFRWKENDDQGDMNNNIFDHKINKKANRSLSLSMKGYDTPNCPCIRFGLDMRGLDAARVSAMYKPHEFPEWFIDRFKFQGHSTCSDYATQRGGGQKVVSYSYYNPDNVTDAESVHYKKYLGQLHGRARVIGKVYPGWLMRIYHNVTANDPIATKVLCNIVCAHQHVDLCDVTKLPGLGNLVGRGVVGRLWRFAVMGDPTVESFMCRDSDSWVLNREVVAVTEWLNSGQEFHVIRDHPHHRAVMLAGLWGGHNKRRSTLAKIRDSFFEHPTNLSIKFDQFQLATKLWPIIKNNTLQHDSYTCNLKTHQGSKPFPVRRIDGMYCGWGPFKFRERRVIFSTKCPIECRPPSNHSWTYC